MAKLNVNKDRSENVIYDYPDYQIYIRLGTLSVFPNYAADSHWHDDMELLMVLDGEMLYNVNGEIVTLNKGEGILVNAKQLHYGFSDEKKECTYICVLFHPMLLCTTKMFEREYVERVLNSGIAYFHLSPNVKWQAEILQCIKNIYEKKDEKTAPLYIQGNIFLLWNEIASQLEDTDKSEKCQDSKLTTLKNMIAYIHEYYSEKIMLADIAAAGHISKRSCGMLFLQYLNKTPVEFLTDYRFRKSIELMKNTDMTILEISVAVGFSSASYYAEGFRAYFGKSPTEYRKNLTEN